MTPGKQTCKILKEIRRQIAEANGIELATSECRYKGECRGTCPKCEAEVRYLEQQLRARSLTGRAVSLAGISVSALAMMLPACSNANHSQAPDKSISETDTISALAPADSCLALNDTISSPDESINDPKAATPCPDIIDIVGECDYEGPLFSDDEEGEVVEYDDTDTILIQKETTEVAATATS